MAASWKFPFANATIAIGGIGFTVGRVLDNPAIVSAGITFGVIGSTIFVVSFVLNNTTKKPE